MNRRWESKVAFVTGGAAGIGAAIARRFVAEGAQVLAGDRDQPRGEALCAELGPSAVFQALEVSEASSFAAAIDRAVERWHRLDILVNNAGIALPAEPVQDTSLEQFEQLVDVNLRSLFSNTSHTCENTSCIPSTSKTVSIRPRRKPVPLVT